MGMSLPRKIRDQCLELAGASPGPARPAKYRNRKTLVDGITFDSKREADRWVVLRAMEKGGGIRDLRRQVSYRLEVNGHLIARYRADFVYEVDGKVVVNDSKGFKTPEYKLKKKLMLACHGISITES